jgi:alginate O-acetyltransferase complex protein AlgI
MCLPNELLKQLLVDILPKLFERLLKKTLSIYNNHKAMQFNSLLFFSFYIITAAVYYIVPALHRWIILLAASIYFFMCTQPGYLLVLGGIIFSVFYGAQQLQKASADRKKSILYSTIITMLILVLVFFKYFNFVNQSLADALSFISIKNTIPYLQILAPLGISYFIFQSIGYLIDIKNEKYNAEKHLGHYALFMMYFPHISSGPIARGNRFLPQLKTTAPFKKENLYAGAAQIFYGLFKKVVVGDSLGDYVSIFYLNYTSYNGFAALVNCWLFLFQLYADFSGYSDMAVGFSKILGIEITNNFETPLFSKTMTEVWRRWHISLSTWLRDYLFTPIVVAKRDWGKYAVVFAQMITFAICGIWHGAGWLFLVYGLIQGFYLSAEFLLGIKSSFYNKNFLRKCLGVFITINLYSLSLVFFKSTNWQQATGVLQHVFTNFFSANFKFYDTALAVSMFTNLAIMLLFDYSVLRKNNWNNLIQVKPKTSFAYCIVLVTLIFLFGISSSTQFIYFQF